MLFRRTRHPLPSFPPKVIPTFYACCEELTDEDFASFAKEAEASIEASLSETPDPKLFKQIEGACRALLSQYQTADPKSRPLIVGALRYCLLAEDAMSDEAFAAGYLDDVKVLNHVLEVLGLEDRYINFRH